MDSHTWDDDAMFRLIAGVYRQAIRDAKADNQQAIAWLDVVAPDWREQVYRHTGRVDFGELSRAVVVKSLTPKRRRPAHEPGTATIRRVTIWLRI
jgi:hypothetical protein